MPAAAALFREAFGVEPEVLVGAPGRVNLIGEHTDYNDGFVLPAAIDLEMELAAGPGSTTEMRSREDADAATYVRAVARALGVTAGVRMAVASDVPVGAGLSSSAALELATARALCALEGREWQPVAMAQACQRAENDFVGNRCGIMDQLAVTLGQAGHALFIDCRSSETRAVAIPAGLAIVIADSAKPRQLVASAYNERRAACEEAARRLGAAALRDAQLGMLARLPYGIRERARHVVEENQRVLDMVQALRAGDLAAAGRLMFASHASLRDLYQVSCPELDLLVDLAAGLPGCIGSRLTGAGFGGCTVSLVRAEAAGEFAAELERRYRDRTGLPGRAYVCRAVDGVRLMWPGSGGTAPSP